MSHLYISKEILDKSLETHCEHYFCASCLSEALANQATEVCPVWKLRLSDSQVKPATIPILCLIGEVGCKRCNRQHNYENATSHVFLPASHLPSPSAETANLPLLLSGFPWLFSPHLQSLLFTKNRKWLDLLLCLTLCWFITFYVVLWCNKKLENLPKLEY